MCRISLPSDIVAAAAVGGAEKASAATLSDVSTCLAIAAVAARRGWEVQHPTSADDGPAPLSPLSARSSPCSARSRRAEATVVLVRGGDLDIAEELLLSLRERRCFFRSAVPIVVALVGASMKAEGEELDGVAWACEAQRRLLSSGADEVFPAFSSLSEDELELGIAMRIANFDVAQSSTKSSRRSLSFDFLDYTDDEDNSESDCDGGWHSDAGDSTSQTVSEAESDKTTAAPSSSNLVEVGTNTDISMDIQITSGALRCMACSRPPKMPSQTAVCATGPAQPDDSDDWSGGAAVGFSDGLFDGRWVAAVMLGNHRPGSRLCPAFRSIHISGRVVTLSDGQSAEVEESGGKCFLLGGELSVDHGKLVRKGSSGVTVVFCRERRDISTSGSTVQKRCARRSRREMMRDFLVRHLLSWN